MKSHGCWTRCWQDGCWNLWMILANVAVPAQENGLLHRVLELVLALAK